MSQTVTFHHAISGYLTGRIWQGIECFKHVDYDCSAAARRNVQPLTLRDHAIEAASDGDFYGGMADLADAELVTVAHITRGARCYKRVKRTPLSRFPSVADMVRLDWDGPTYDD